MIHFMLVTSSYFTILPHIQHTHLHGVLCPRAGVIGHLDPVRPTLGRPSAVIAQDLQYLLA